ncbi:Deaminated glutathione amidase [Seminavis robusta]|uniref:Deaminated glutathione amidase n=1 Tax=Seminavis robusta TaxID=568900 RepID=A0A9N8HFR8_9STRA|nr:Deaminated glutathione amidase [Seminavis robusta]|eukprot:Sro361_g126640.1 Deaminated glutathione amidase (296) ;mRNA; r:61214-62181
MSSHTTSQPRRAAIAQLCSTSHKLHNLVNVAKCAGWAQREGASILFLPECFGFIGESGRQTVEQADPPVVVGDVPVEYANDASISELLETTVAAAANGETSVDESTVPNDNLCILDALKTIATKSGLWISGGGMHIAGAPPAEGSNLPRVYNTHIIMDNQGVVKCLYRKIHLFNVHIPDKVNLRESDTTAPGTELVVCDSPIGKLGLSTCYDIRFPEMYIPLVNQMGAQILLVPSAFTVPTGSAHWHTLLRARAIEHQCYVLAAAQYGRHNHKRESYGELHRATQAPRSSSAWVS